MSVSTVVRFGKIKRHPTDTIGREVVNGSGLVTFSMSGLHICKKMFISVWPEFMLVLV